MTQPVCAIPGAGPGNGLALAKRFAAAGERVALMARRQAQVEERASAIAGARGYACDVTDPDSVTSAFDAVREQQGPITTLLYNAGNAVFGNAEQITPDDFETAWRTNALGLFHCVHAVLPDMRGAGGGAIMVTGATASKRGGANFAGFAAAKAAQYSLAQSLARQLGPEGIHVAITIVDGVVDSKATRDFMPDRGDDAFMQPDAIAEAVFQLTRQDASAWTFELDLRPAAESW